MSLKNKKPSRSLKWLNRPISTNKKETDIFLRPKSNLLGLLKLLGFFIGCLLLIYGIANTGISLFYNQSIQIAINAILFILTGLILIYISSHDRFINKNLTNKQR